MLAYKTKSNGVWTGEVKDVSAQEGLSPPWVRAIDAPVVPSGQFAVFVGSAWRIVTTEPPMPTSAPVVASDTPEFLSPSGIDDAPAIVAMALKNGGDVYLRPGVFNIVGNVRLATRLRLFGAGMYQTVIKCAHNQKGALLIDPGTNEGVIEGCHIADLTLDGQVETLGFSEHRHLLALHGVKNAIVERVFFKSFRGDGVYLGSGPDVGQYRHNSNVTIRDCVFNGGNSDNRNGISIIDCAGAKIYGNEISSCSRADMPGGIDIEPNISKNIIRNIKIYWNKFKGISGHSACKLFVSAYVADVRPSGIRFIDNEIEDCNIALSFDYVTYGGGEGGALEVMDIIASDNKVKNCLMPFDIQASHSVLMRDNNFFRCRGEARVGWIGSNATPLYPRIEGNTFQQCGYDTASAVFGAGLLVSESYSVKIRDNHFIDCGTGAAGYKNGIVLMQGTSRGILLDGNEFLSPLGVMTTAVLKKADHIYADATKNADINNIKNGMAWGL